MKNTITDQQKEIIDVQEKREFREFCTKLPEYLEELLFSTSRETAKLYAKRRKVLISFLKYLEKAFCENEYGFYYDNDFRKNHSPLLVVGEFKRNKVDKEIYLQTTRKTNFTFAQLEKFASENIDNDNIASHKFFYIHTPPRTKKEVVCFDSIATALGYMSLMGYSTMWESSSKCIATETPWWKMPCVNNQRKKVKTEDQGKKFVKKQGSVELLPSWVYCESNLNLRMQRISEKGFFADSFKGVEEILPVINELQTTLPYWIYLLYANLRHNHDKVELALRGFKQREEKRVINLYLGNIRFDQHDLRFLKFLLDEISLIQNEFQTLIKKKHCAKSIYMDILKKQDLPLYRDTLDMFKGIDIMKTVRFLQYKYRNDASRVALIEDTLLMKMVDPDDNEYLILK